MAKNKSAITCELICSALPGFIGSLNRSRGAAICVVLVDICRCWWHAAEGNASFPHSELRALVKLDVDVNTYFSKMERITRHVEGYLGDVTLLLLGFDEDCAVYDDEGLQGNCLLARLSTMEGWPKKLREPVAANEAEKEDELGALYHSGIRQGLLHPDLLTDEWVRDRPQCFSAQHVWPITGRPFEPRTADEVSGFLLWLIAKCFVQEHYEATQTFSSRAADFLKHLTNPEGASWRMLLETVFEGCPGGLTMVFMVLIRCALKNATDAGSDNIVEDHASAAHKKRRSGNFSSGDKYALVRSDAVLLFRVFPAVAKIWKAFKRNTSWYDQKFHVTKRKGAECEDSPVPTMPGRKAEKIDRHMNFM